MQLRKKQIEKYNRFNRYMVECEWRFIKRMYPRYIVLIDTWWNVNNTSSSRFIRGGGSFNRYMVECE